MADQTDGFQGEFECDFDEKGRVLIPSKFRDALGTSVTIARGAFGQINVYPKAVFAELVRIAEDLGAEEAPIAKRIVSAANEYEMDRQGRILIPSVLRKHGKLDGEVIVTGNVNHLEIWNPDEWFKVYGEYVEINRKQSRDSQRLKELAKYM